MNTHMAGRLPASGLRVSTPLSPSFAGRAGLALLFLAAGLATFIFGSNYFRLFATNWNPAYEGGLAALCLAAALALRRSERWRPLWPVAYAFFVANMVWLVTTLVGGFGGWALRLAGYPGAEPVRAAVAKVGEAIGATAIILALCLPAGLNLGSLYLRRGNLKWAVGIGVLVILNFTTASLMATATQPRSLDVLGQLLLWGAVFSAANGFMEELWFRGLLLGRMEPLIGTGGAVLVTALTFSLAHMGANYMLTPEALAVFVVNTFTHALVLGYLIVKTNTLWGAVLYHMAMDLWLFIGPLNP